MLLGLILAVVLVVHLSFLSAGTGHGVLRLDQTLQALVMTMRGNDDGFTRRGLTQPDPKMLGIWVGAWTVGRDFRPVRRSGDRIVPLLGNERVPTRRIVVGSARAVNLQWVVAEALTLPYAVGIV